MNENMNPAVPAEETPAVEAVSEQTPAESPAEVPAEAPAEVPAEAPAETPAAPESSVVPAAEPPKKVKKVKKPRSRPLKILMELIAIVLCLVIFVVTIAGSLALDLRVMTSRGGIQKIVTQLIMPSMSVPANDSLFAIHSVSAPHLSSDVTIDSSSSGILTDVAYDMLKSQFGDEISLTKEQVAQFMAESTASEFLTDKLSGAVEDFYNGTATTTITPQEIIKIVEDNTDVIEKSFDIEISEDSLKEMETNLEDVEILTQIEQDGLIGYLEKTYLSDEPAGESGGNAGSAPDNSVGSTPDTDSDSGSTPDTGTNSVSSAFGRLTMIKQTMEFIRQVTSYTAIAIMAGALLLLALLLWLVNGTLPKTLSDLGITLLAAGLLLSSLNIMADAGALQLVLPGQPGLIGLISGMLSVISVVHYSVLGAGFGLILLAIAAKIIKSNRQKKALKAAQ